MANYLTTDTDLTAVANAIRTKGGTSASLSFPSGFVTAIQNISGGIGSPIHTQSLGTISTTTTSATSLNTSIVIDGINPYDLLVVITSVDTITNNRHTATISLVFLTGSTNISNKSSGGLSSTVWNSKMTSSVTSTRSSTTAYGVYPYSCTVTNGTTEKNGTVTLPRYRRYNSTNTGTMNGSYTTRVYGVKLYELIGS